MYLHPTSLLLLLAYFVDINAANPTAPVPPAPAAPAGPPLIKITPPNLVVKPGEAHCELQVVLLKKPVGRARVYMEASNFAFDSGCVLEFDPNKWDQPLKLKAIPLPYFTDATVNRDVEATFKISAPTDPSMNRNELKYKITRDKGKAAICQSNGDPHYLGFNGIRYDFQGTGGNYYLLQSNFLTIQTQTKKWINTAYINEALTVRFGKVVYMVHADKGLTCLSPGARTGVEVIESANKKSFHFKFSDGSELKVNSNFSHMNYLDITVELAEHGKGQVKGLCGKWDDAKENKFFGPDGNVIAKVEEWGEKWRVPDNDNLFKCNQQSCPTGATGGYAVMPINFCKIPKIGDAQHPVPPMPPYQPPSSGYTVAKPVKPYNIAPPKIDRNPMPNKKCKDTHAKKCDAICKIAVHDNFADKYLDTEPYLSTCRRDCREGGTFDFVDGHKSSYLDRLRTIEKTLECSAKEAKKRVKNINAAANGAYGVQIQAPDAQLVQGIEASAAEINQLKLKFGLGGAKCPSKTRAPCSGNGSCAANGCSCKQGWTGFDCSYNLQKNGYFIRPNEVIFTREIVVPKPPKRLPGCKPATLNLAAVVAEASQQLPSIAQAQVPGGMEGGMDGPPPMDGGMDGPPLDGPPSGPAGEEAEPPMDY